MFLLQMILTDIFQNCYLAKSMDGFTVQRPCDIGGAIKVARDVHVFSY